MSAINEIHLKAIEGSSVYDTPTPLTGTKIGDYRLVEQTDYEDTFSEAGIVKRFNNYILNRMNQDCPTVSTWAGAVREFQNLLKLRIATNIKKVKDEHDSTAVLIIPCVVRMPKKALPDNAKIKDIAHQFIYGKWRQYFDKRHIVNHFCQAIAPDKTDEDMCYMCFNIQFFHCNTVEKWELLKNMYDGPPNV